MVHTRINERTPNPNPFFISSLQKTDQDAIDLLRALAAQVKPLMKDHGFKINSLEEHMNHSAAFHNLRCQLTTEVFALQRRGYFGDGYWSAGTRLADSRRITVGFTPAQGLPAYTCGGAYNQSRQLALLSRKRQRRRIAGPSLTTGAQTVKRRKAGSRVTSKATFSGEGHVLNSNVQKGTAGSGFGKRAASQKAREERAAAAERRLKGFKEVPDDEGDSDYELIEKETDRQRLEMMQELTGNDLDLLRDDDCTDSTLN